MHKTFACYPLVILVWIVSLIYFPFIVFLNLALVFLLYLHHIPCTGTLHFCICSYNIAALPPTRFGMLNFGSTSGSIWICFKHTCASIIFIFFIFLLLLSFYFCKISFCHICRQTQYDICHFCCSVITYVYHSDSFWMTFDFSVQLAVIIQRSFFSLPSPEDFSGSCCKMKLQ